MRVNRQRLVALHQKLTEVLSSDTSPEEEQLMAEIEQMTAQLHEQTVDQSQETGAAE